MNNNRTSIRLKGYDYSQAGEYFITICCQHRLNHFGKIKNDEMILNQYGKIAHDEWLNTVNKRTNVTPDVFVIMPNHIHAILILNDQCRGELHSSLGNQSATSIKQSKASAFHSPSQTIGAIIRGYKSSVTKQLNALNFEGQLWQRGYYDHIIRNEKSYQTICDYIINNPAKWSEDKFYTP